MGFEPTASTLTGWRALQAAPRGQNVSLVAQVGLEPTVGRAPHMVVGVLLLVRFSAQSRSRTCKHPGLSQAARRWRIWAWVGLGGLEPPIVFL